MLSVLDQLRELSKNLSVVTNVLGPVEPGQAIEVEVLSTAQQATASDPLGLQAVVGTLPAAQLLSQMSVRLKVDWKVFRVVEGVKEELTLGKDFLMPTAARGETAGMTGDKASMLFSPPIIELEIREGLPPTTTIRIEPTITLSALLLAGPIPQYVEFVVPNDATRRMDPDYLVLTLDLLPLEIPSLLILFRHDRFRPFQNDMTPGFALAIFRGGAPFREVSELTNKVLQRIEDVVRPLKSLAGFAAFLAKLPMLRSALGAQPMVRTLAGRVSDLDNIHMRTDTFLGFDILERDLRANDRASSLIFLGPPGSAVDCFNDEDFADGEGQFTVTAGLSLIVLVPELKGIDPSTPIEGITIVTDDDDDDGFENSMTSVRFR